MTGAALPAPSSGAPMDSLLANVGAAAAFAVGWLAKCGTAFCWALEWHVASHC